MSRIAVLRATLPQSRSALIIELLPLAERVAYSFARREPREREDFLGCSRLGLSQAIQWVCEGRCPHENLEGYVVSTCKRFCSDWVGVLNARAQGLGDYWVVPAVEDSSIIVADIMSHFTARQQEILNHRMAGLSGKEIAAEMGMSEPWVVWETKKIQERYAQLV
jgi:DNA-directed RNA polymerase specialized sigma24 family protein